MPRIDLDAIAPRNDTGYPPPHDAPMAKRHYRRLAEAGGISDFEVNHVMLEPGGISSQRHWHEGEDEFLVMLSGEAVLVEEGTRTPLRAGDCVAFPKGVANGHHLVNESGAPCAFVAMGLAETTPCHYPDIDMRWDPITGRCTREDGSPL